MTGNEERRPSREEAIAAAGSDVAAMLRTREQLTPRELAEASWTPTSKHSVDELEDLIREERGMTPLDRGGDT